MASHQDGSGSMESLALAKRWHHKCKTSHSTCRGMDSESLPTRLIEMCDGFLKERENLSQSTQYVTLSHCCGDNKYMRPLEENIQQMKVKIPKDQACQTFQDVVKTCQFLGFKYIWIGSFCIVHNDQEDWQREVVSMSRVYGNSSLNISVSHA